MSKFSRSIALLILTSLAFFLKISPVRSGWRSLSFTVYSWIREASNKTTIVRGQNMQLCQSLRCKLIDMPTTNIDFSRHANLSLTVYWVNVPTDINSIVSTLPRSINESDTLSLSDSNESWVTSIIIRFRVLDHEKCWKQQITLLRQVSCFEMSIKNFRKKWCLWKSK